jgi:hypothetical protein
MMMFSGDDAWCASVTNEQQYIQVDFPIKTRVTRIVTYGRRTKLFWVTRYSLQFSNDETTWQYYNENGFKKVGFVYSWLLGLTSEFTGMGCVGVHICKVILFSPTKD